MHPLDSYGAAAQWPPLPLSPLYFTYKYKGGEHKRRGQKGEGGRPRERKKRRPEKEERKEEQEKKKKKKQREKQGKTEGRNRPPPPTAAPLGTTAVSLHSSHRMLVPRLSLLPSSPSLLRLPLLSFACRTWAIHVLQQMKIISWLLCCAQ